LTKKNERKSISATMTRLAIAFNTQGHNMNTTSTEIQAFSLEAPTSIPPIWVV